MTSKFIISLSTGTTFQYFLNVAILVGIMILLYFGWYIFICGLYLPYNKKIQLDRAYKENQNETKRIYVERANATAKFNEILDEYNVKFDEYTNTMLKHMELQKEMLKLEAILNNKKKDLIDINNNSDTVTKDINCLDESTILPAEDNIVHPDEQQTKKAKANSKKKTKKTNKKQS